jgi:hypothetical protein
LKLMNLIKMITIAALGAMGNLNPSHTATYDCRFDSENVLSVDSAKIVHYFPSHNLLNLERLKRSIFKDDHMVSCNSYIAINWKMKVCIRGLDPIRIIHYILYASESRVKLERYICNLETQRNHSTQYGDDNEMSVMTMKLDYNYKGSLGNIFQEQFMQFGNIWLSVQQLNININACGEEKEMGMDVQFAANLADLYENMNVTGFQLFSALSSQCAPGTRTPPELLLASGFPHECKHELGYIKLQMSKTSTLLSSIAYPPTLPSVLNGMDAMDIEITWDSAMILGHLNSCSNLGSFALSIEHGIVPSYRWSFPLMHEAKYSPNPLRYLAAVCRMSCELNPDCRSFSWTDDRIHASPRSGRCVGCRDSSWNPHRRAGCATGVISSNYTWSRWPGGEAAFFLQGEPKGGWTLTDLPGLVHSTDMQMLDWSLPLPPPSLPAHWPALTRPPDRWAASDDWDEWRPAGCEGRARAAAVYLVGGGDDDMDALGLSLASLDRYLLAAHGWCYPVFFFRERWDAAAQARIASMTGARVYFYIADMSFPAGFDASRHASAQAKRSAWGYQHMSRFWLRTVLEHAAVARLEWYLRLDTDSRLASPALDLFQDARARRLAYAYRVAGKDWLGRNRGLWAWHRHYLRRAGPAAQQARAAGGLVDLVLAGPAGDGTEAPIFYTNFEVVNVARFREGDLWEYVVAVDESWGVYRHNWGDAQVRWLQVSTWLPAAAVHRYCHFGYAHAAAASPAFGCWQEPWVGVDCPAPACALHGRHPARLLHPDHARVVFGPPLPRTAPSTGSITVHGLCRPSDLPLAAGQEAAAGGGPVRYRVWWMGTAAGGRGGPQETECSRGTVHVHCNDDVADGEHDGPARARRGQVVVGYGPGEASNGGVPATALVLEMAMGWRRNGCCGCRGTCGGGMRACEEARMEAECVSEAEDGLAASCGEAFMLVFPYEDAPGDGGEGDGGGVGGSGSYTGGGQATDMPVFVDIPVACDDDDSDDVGGDMGERSAEMGRCAGAAVGGWYDVVRWAMLSEEYVSRHLRAQQGRTDVRDLPGDVEDVLKRVDAMAMPYRARLVVVHWVVLVLLAQPGALHGLAELLARYAAGVQG